MIQITYQTTQQDQAKYSFFQALEQPFISLLIKVKYLGCSSLSET